MVAYSQGEATHEGVFSLSQISNSNWTLWSSLDYELQQPSIYFVILGPSNPSKTAWADS